MQIVYSGMIADLTSFFGINILSLASVDYPNEKCVHSVDELEEQIDTLEKTNDNRERLSCTKLEPLNVKYRIIPPAFLYPCGIAFNGRGHPFWHDDEGRAVKV